VDERNGRLLGAEDDALERASEPSATERVPACDGRELELEATAAIETAIAAEACGDEMGSDQRIGRDLRRSVVPEQARQDVFALARDRLRRRPAVVVGLLDVGLGEACEGGAGVTLGGAGVAEASDRRAQRVERTTPRLDQPVDEPSVSSGRRRASISRSISTSSSARRTSHLGPPEAPTRVSKRSGWSP